jgi:hypothetical protein
VTLHNSSPMLHSVEPGLYPFVSHAFASASLGQVGLLNVAT